MEIGDKVICIDDSFKGFGIGELKEGETYTIIGFFLEGGGVILAEVSSDGWMGSYLITRFRKIDMGFGVKICERLKEEIKLDNLWVN